MKTSWLIATTWKRCSYIGKTRRRIKLNISFLFQRLRLLQKEKEKVFEEKKNICIKFTLKIFRVIYEVCLRLSLKMEGNNFCTEILVKQWREKMNNYREEIFFNSICALKSAWDLRAYLVEIHYNLFKWMQFIQSFSHSISGRKY